MLLGHYRTNMTTLRGYFHINSCQYIIGQGMKFYNMEENVLEVTVFLSLPW